MERAFTFMSPEDRNGLFSLRSTPAKDNPCQHGENLEAASLVHRKPRFGLAIKLARLCEARRLVT